MVAWFRKPVRRTIVLRMEIEMRSILPRELRLGDVIVERGNGDKPVKIPVRHIEHYACSKRDTHINHNSCYAWNVPLKVAD